MRHSVAHWGMLLSLVVLWGSSYLMVEIALAIWNPAEITALRVSAAAIVLLAVLFVRRDAYPGGRRPWMFIAAIAVIGNCVPFFLISWGQQQVESGLAGILAATTPLAVLILGHFALDDEPLSGRHSLAFVLGFAGIVVLMGPDSLAAVGGSPGRWLSQSAILAGAICYAVATVAARRMPAISPVAASAGVMLLASIIMSPFGVEGSRAFTQAPWQPVAAIGFLGLLGTGLASILYFRLVAQTSARFTSLLNYLVPVWAVGLGTLVLGEDLPLSTWAAMALIIAGLIMTAGPANKNEVRE